MYLVAQPEVAYLKGRDGIVERWYAPENCFFRAMVEELPEGTSPEEARKRLVIGDKPFYIKGERR